MYLMKMIFLILCRVKTVKKINLKNNTNKNQTDSAENERQKREKTNANQKA